MNNQTLLLVDDNNKFLGYASREECHTGKGRRHRAFVTLLFDKNNQVLLQKRRHRLFDGLWDLTAISHPLHVNGRDESFQQASDRALAKEMGIGHVKISDVGAFNYYAKDGRNCENEHCAVLLGKYDGEFRPIEEEVYEAKKVDFDEFLRDVEKSPKKYTPWAVLAAKKLKNLGQNQFKSDLERFLKVFDPYAKDYFRRKIKEAKNYPNLIAQFYKDLEEFSLGGKKMRGYLVWLGCQIAGGRDLKRVLPVSLAFEIVQDFFLIHDDIIDQSDLRRGKPTVYKKYEKYFGPHYGASQAIMIGDLALVESIRLFDEQGAQVRVEFLKSTTETVFGEGLDVEYAFGDPSFDQIRRMVDLKAARYSFLAPLRIGAIMGKASSRQLTAIDKFSLSCGVAFQIQDDLLGVFGDERTMGKSLLSDMVEGKNTLMIYKARELARGQDRKDLDRLWGKKTATFSDLARVREIIKKCGAYDWVFEEKARLAARARDKIGKITKDAKLGLILSDIVEFVVGRQN